MRKNMVIVAAVVAAGLVSWNEYRVWSMRNHPRPLPLLVANSNSDGPLPWVPEHGADSMVSQQIASNQPTGEEECDATIIDLTLLQQQTVEPPLADTDEPPTAPKSFKGSPTGGVVGNVQINWPEAPPSVLGLEMLGLKPSCARMPYILPNVPQFRPFSADPNDCWETGTTADLWTKVVEFIDSVLHRDESAGRNQFKPEELHVMPRPYDTQYHSEHPGCPYLGGCPYDNVRYHRSLPESSSAGEEQQDKPPSNPKPNDTHKQPKIDTMEIRPGDLPLGGLRKSF